MSTPHSRDLRKGRHSLPGYCYLLTIATAQRRPVFCCPQHAATASRHFYSPAVQQHGVTLSHVVMPDHVHWLIQLSGKLSMMVRIYKAKVSMTIGEPVWQTGFHDHALRREEDLKAVARYIVANPLRAGLVTDINHYPYWNAIWL